LATSVASVPPKDTLIGIALAKLVVATCRRLTYPTHPPSPRRLKYNEMLIVYP
jgi:hypothetical protein